MFHLSYLNSKMTVCCDELIEEKKVKYFIIRMKGKTEVTKEAQNDEKPQTTKEYTRVKLPILLNKR